MINKNKIVKEYKKTEWGTWNKIVRAKKTIDIMNEYLESRDTDDNPLIGNYRIHIKQWIALVFSIEFLQYLE